MEKIQLFVGLKITVCEDATTWRILYVDPRITVLIQIDTTRRNLIQCVTNELISKICSNHIVPDYEEPTTIVDLKNVSISELEKYNKKLSFIREVQKAYGPTYMELSGKSKRYDFISIYQKYHFERHNAYRYVFEWLKSGFNDYSLLNKNTVIGTSKERTYKAKPGTHSSTGIVISDVVKKQFDYGVDAYLKNRVMHKKDAYELVLYTYYSSCDGNRIVLKAPDERPTEKQFKYYLNKKLSAADIERKKTSRREYDNNSRLFLHSPIAHDMGPGSIIEVDAMEMDFNVVSVFNNQKNIGRPILYMLTDRYSHCIVGFHVGFDNNSMLGLTNAILNLFDDRAYVLQAHGITNFDLHCWPSPFIPNEFWCDRGSDFASNEFERICRELNIVRTLEEPAMGSMKGLIERSFGLFNTLVLPLLFGKGLIEKRYDSTHMQDACLTISEAYQIAAAFVQYRNSTPMKSYRPSIGMMKACIDLSPMSIWNYGCELVGPPRPVTPNNQLLNMYKLLKPVTGMITREGISYKGLVYCNAAQDDLLRLMSLAKSNMNKRDVYGRKLNAIDIRIDPRSIDEIYYIAQGSIRIVKLAEGRNGDYCHMTWDEYDDCFDNLKNLKKAAAESILRNRTEARVALSEIINGAVTQVRANSKDIRLNREIDMNESNFNNRVVERLSKDKLKEKTNAINSDLNCISLETKELNVKNTEIEDSNESSLFDSECPEELFNWGN